ncbi:MAG: long-chain fatty acid--CoA ligase, partial [Clostridia bacterium]|nr:long-chain fatty acid--CoA ligase [Clostridia bacterium]
LVSAHIFPDFAAVKQELGEGYTDEAVRELIDKQIKEINVNMASYKKIQAFDIRKEEFIKTTTRKIKRYAN